VLAVAKGDGTFRWAGAAGIASQQGMLPMSAVTPELDLYVSGTIDQTASRIKPFVVMWRVMRAIEAAGSTR